MCFKVELDNIFESFRIWSYALCVGFSRGEYAYLIYNMNTAHQTATYKLSWQHWQLVKNFNLKTKYHITSARSSVNAKVKKKRKKRIIIINILGTENYWIELFYFYFYYTYVVKMISCERNIIIVVEKKE